VKKLIHVTDLHLPLPGTLLYGLDPYARLDACIAHINTNHADADLVIITGDLTDNGDAAAYAALAERLPNLVPPVRLLIGNHDDRATFFATFPNVVPASGFAQGSADLDEARVVWLDTLRTGHVEGELCETRLQWLDAALSETGDAPTFVFMHHPPFAIHLPALDGIALRGGDAFHARLAQHGNVRHIFAGHVHRPASGTWHGIGFNTMPGTSHQSAAFFAESRFEVTLEAPAYGVVFIENDSVVVHTINFLD
jgi:3',5'-cyclic AMP phosphodiesterase CpdA